jgi:uncharacterized protein (TIGR00369 family)
VLRWGDEWACLDAGNGLFVGLVLKLDGAPDESVGFVVPDSLDSAVAVLGDAGLSVERSSQSGGVVEFARFRDPDGHAVYLTNAPPNPTATSATQTSLDGYRPFFEHLGLGWNTLDENKVSVEIDIRDDLRGPAGTLQGGIIATLVDVAAASTAALAGSSFVATTEMTIHFLAPGRVGPVRATGELLRSGARGFAVETRVVDSGMDDRLMAVALAAFAEIDPTRRPS